MDAFLILLVVSLLASITLRIGSYLMKRQVDAAVPRDPNYPEARRNWSAKEIDDLHQKYYPHSRIKYWMYTAVIVFLIVALAHTFLAYFSHR